MVKSWCQPEKAFRRGASRIPTRQMSQRPEDREWTLCVDNQAENVSRKFRLSSWNILAQDYADRCQYLYRHLSHKKHLLSWNERWRKIKAEIECLNSDVLCLQEVQHSSYLEKVRPFLESLDYNMGYLQKGNNLPDGSLIAFKEENFKRIFTREVHMYHEDKCATGQIALILLLQHLKSGEFLLVTTTHLVFNPYRGDWKLKQIIEVVAEIQDYLGKEDQSTAVVLCGDFNSQPHSSLVNYLLQSPVDISGVKAKDISKQDYDFNSRRNYYATKHGGAGSREVDGNFLWGTGLMKNSTFSETDERTESSSRSNVISHEVKLQNAYQGAEEAKTAVTSEEAVHVDYILHNERLTVVRRHDLPSPFPIPNEIYGSDHFSLSVDFKFKL